MALAVIFAYIGGAYAHAVGNAHHETPHAASGLADGPSIAAAAAHVDGEYEGADATDAHGKCCDFLCHGGHAILARLAVISHPPRCAVAVLPREWLSITQSNRLERPPRSPALS
jgi:hypothetical protein